MTLNTYVPLRTTTVPSATSSVTLDLTGITGYTDLQIVANVMKGENSPSPLVDMVMRFNGDAGTNYSWTGGSGYVSGTISPTRLTNTTSIYTDYYAELDFNYPGVRDITIFNFSATDMYKTVYVRAGKGTEGTDMIQGLYRGVTGSSKEAITSVTFLPNSGTIKAGSVFTVYGIANTLAQGAKATGGAVYQDSNYFYHAFNATGVFTPSQSLSVEYLIAGGGGGAGGVGSTWSGAGGGGGGRILTGTSSVTATNYTITVGGGGNGGSGGTNGSVGTTSTFNAINATGGLGGIAVNGPGNNGGNSGSGFTGGIGAGASSPGYGGGGGAGDSANGVTATSTKAGNGGAGTSYAWQGLLSPIGGGGGGGTYNGATYSTQGLGVDGGANGNIWVAGTSQNGNSAVVNRAGGGGGAGGGDNGGSYNGGNGGSGVVIIRYAR